jgi:endonuclease/exonuclease/phosphatase family metal-dependent hydrolase
MKAVATIAMHLFSNSFVYNVKFRNLLKVTIELPWSGEFDFYCTQLDHLDENWRMKQMNSIIQSTDCPHILAGGLNALSVSDYSSERWTDIVKVMLLLHKVTLFSNGHYKKCCYRLKFIVIV